MSEKTALACGKRVRSRNLRKDPEKKKSIDFDGLAFRANFSPLKVDPVCKTRTDSKNETISFIGARLRKGVGWQNFAKPYKMRNRKGCKLDICMFD
jgi:hypothetical protein